MMSAQFWDISISFQFQIHTVFLPLIRFWITPSSLCADIICEWPLSWDLPPLLFHWSVASSEVDIELGLVAGMLGVSELLAGVHGEGARALAEADALGAVLAAVARLAEQ